MPIVVRRGRVVAEPRSRLLRFERLSTAAAPPGAVGIAATGPDPRHELARLALDVVVRTAAPIDAPPSWLRPGFAMEVDRARAQLAPIRTRKGLMASFSREATIAATRVPGGPVGATPAAQPPPGPIRVAYAIRWLELGDGRPRGSWAGIVRGSLVDVEAAAAPAPAPAPAASVAAPDDQRIGERIT